MGIFGLLASVDVHELFVATPVKGLELAVHLQLHVACMLRGLAEWRHKPPRINSKHPKASKSSQ